MNRIAFVSAIGGSAFMAELLAVVAHAVTDAGGDAICHDGRIEDVADGNTVFVVVPHEYFVICGVPAAPMLRSTVGFGVEHPGTKTFDVARSLAPLLAASLEIGSDSVAALARHGVSAERFVLGYSALWDRRSDVDERDIEALYLGTADEKRLAELALMAPDLARLKAELLLPPHEPMTRPRPDFAMGDEKWRLLARSKILLNLHREGSTAFEWVRALEAISNGCVVLSAPSTGLAPLVPGEHLLVADPARMGLVARAALADSTLLELVAARAEQACRDLDMISSARRLIDIAESVKPAAAAPPSEPIQAQDSVEPPMATWVPMASASSSGNDQVARVPRGSAHFRAERVPGATVDLVCFCGPETGPLARTMAAMDECGVDVNRFVVESADNASRCLNRNEMLRQGEAPHVLVLDSGDEFLSAEVLPRMIRTLDRFDNVQVAYPMAVLGSDMIVNALVPEERRLAQFRYLSRGYLVRRSWLETLGGFKSDNPDHQFWLSTTRAGAASHLLRNVGIRLWPQPA